MISVDASTFSPSLCIADASLPIFLLYFSGFIFELEGLEEDSTYWVRVKVQNDAGESLWSTPAKVSTTVQSVDDSEETTTVETPDAEPETAGDEEPMSDGAFYGIFFAVGIFVVSFVCMFAMRMVK